MATKKISELTNVTSVQDTDLLLVETSEGTRSIKKSDLISDIVNVPNHNQSASTITAGTFAGQVVAPASTEYTTNMIRNGVFTTTDPGSGSLTFHENGSLIFVYE